MRFSHPATLQVALRRGTRHAAQVVADLINLQGNNALGLWLASFNVAKCFDSLPRWVVFRLL